MRRRAGSFIRRELKEKFADAGAAFDAALMNLPSGRLPAPGAHAGGPDAPGGGLPRARARSPSGKDEESIAKYQAKTGVTDLRDVAQRFLLESEHDVIWGDGEGRRRQLTVAPLSVAGILGHELFAERTVVVTSATRTLGGKFDNAARSLGLDDEGFETLDVGSPFDYRKPGILYVASHLPKPGMSGLSDLAADELVRLVTALGAVLEDRHVVCGQRPRCPSVPASLARRSLDRRPVLAGEPVIGQMQVDAGGFDRTVPGLGLDRLQRHQPAETRLP